MELENLATTLRKNRFEVSVFETKEEARDYLNGVIDGVTVGIGGSQTVKDMGLIDVLKTHNTLYCSATCSDRTEMLRKSMTTDVYILSANGIALDSGYILNIDGTGNRVSSSLYGHKKVYFVVGKNKISPDFHSALDRIHNVVCPTLAERLNKNTPCAKEGDKCYNCYSPERICNALVVMYKKVKSQDIEIVLINENLGI